MLSQSTIDRVFEAADIAEIVGQFVADLKKSGSSYRAKSPFTEEKTPSFYVVPSKGIYKCFSSGKGGGVIGFLQELKGWSFPEAIEYLAKYYHIEIEYEKATEEQKEAATSRLQYLKMNKAANAYFIKHVKDLADDHPANSQLSRFSNETAIEFQVGYTGADPVFLYNKIKEQGLVKDAEDIGLVQLWQGNYQDVFRNRVTFPIHDRLGNIVAFGGRALGDDKPKYLNSKDSPIFSKGKLLYGFFQAQRSIRNTDTAYLTEGYTDVIAMHEIDLPNTVATLGTALTDHHVASLKKHCKTIVLVRDGDAAGLKAARRDMELILAAGMQCGIVMLPEGKDPFDLAHDMEIDDPKQWIEDRVADALSYFSKETLDAAEDPIAKGEALQQIAAWLGLIPDSFVREQYRKQIAKQTKLKEKDLKEREPKAEFKANSYGVKNFLKLPDGVTEEEVLKHGFYGIVERGERENNKTGYWFMSSSETFVKLSNFVLTPLFHKYEMEDNTRVFRLENGVVNPEIVEMPSKALISVEGFRQFLFDKGAYFFKGSKVHLDKLMEKYLFEFPKAFELKTLGWQNEGFFAFYNCVYNGKLEYYDEAGLIKHNDQFFFSPAASTIYSDVRKEDDLFENDRYLSYEETKVTFDEWMELVIRTYGEHAYAGIPFVFIALFRDIVFKVDNNCPFLYLYGQSKSGKSKFAETIMNLFFNQMPAFQLNGGTDFAFASRLQRFRNVPVFLNEFDDNVVKDEWFQMIKGAYDGEGRERGRGGSKRKTEIQKVNASLILVGQYLSTKDDNSILSRSILRTFKIVADRPNDQVDSYNKLKELEKKGISSILTNILKHRDMVKKEYYATFFDVFKSLSIIIRSRKEHYDERILRNYSALLSMVRLFKGVYAFPWEYEEYKAWIINEIIHMSGLISETDILVDFWTFVSSLVDHGELKDDRDYKIQHQTKIRITKSANSDITIDLPEQKRVLYIRLREVWVSYAGAKKKAGGNPIDFTSLKSYMENRDYYLGYLHRQRIGKKSVSCYVLDYEAIGIDIVNEPDESEGYLAGHLNQNTLNDDLPF